LGGITKPNASWGISIWADLGRKGRMQEDYTATWKKPEVNQPDKQRKAPLVS